MRTIEQFLESIIDDEIRYLSIENLTNQEIKNSKLGFKYKLGNEYCSSLYEAIVKAFSIKNAEYPLNRNPKNRVKYWENIHRLSRNGKIDHFVYQNS